MALVALLAGGHLLIEDVPGVGKTTLARTLARCLDCSFQRIQFTSDLLPADIVGVSIYNQQQGEFEFKPGPVFANIILADEINRTTPKTQSSLLEAMSEGRVTVDNRTWELPQPFMVLATQNPSEHHGTYPLPESQLDRFLMRISLGYPSIEEEKAILRQQVEDHPIELVRPILDGAELMRLQAEVRKVTVNDLLLDYLMRIVELTRQNGAIELGISPRGSLMLFRAAQALAFIRGRDYCIADDIKLLVGPVFAHRLVLNQRYVKTRPESAQSDQPDQVGHLLRELLGTIEVPL
jgi:MoxR-like ATPase